MISGAMLVLPVFAASAAIDPTTDLASTSYVQGAIASLATVASTGDYSDLTTKPGIITQAGGGIAVPGSASDTALPTEKAVSTLVDGKLNGIPALIAQGIEDDILQGLDPVEGDPSIILTAIQDAVGDELDAKEDKKNKVTSMSGSSTDDQYPSAKATYDALAGKQSIIGAGSGVVTQTGTAGTVGYTAVTDTPADESTALITAGGVYTAISGLATTASLADVAFSGDYDDLENKPDALPSGSDDGNFALVKIDGTVQWNTIETTWP